jgi:hypothetical protein
VPGPSAAGALPAGSAAGRFAGWVAGCPVDGRRGGVSVAPSTTIPGRVVCAAAVAGITSAPATASQGHAPRGAPDLCLHSSERIAMRPLLRRVIRRSLQRGEPSPHAHWKYAEPSGARRVTALEFSTRVSTATASRPRHSRLYGGPLFRAPRTGDGRPVPAGLLARGSSACSGLPAGATCAGSGMCGEGSPLTVAGAAAASGPMALHRVPFSPIRLRTDENRHDASCKQAVPP